MRIGKRNFFYVVCWKLIIKTDRRIRMADLKFEIKKFIGVIGEGTKGWKKEVNLVSWNERKPKLDIRDWDENHEKMGKGVTLNNGAAEEAVCRDRPRGNGGLTASIFFHETNGQGALFEDEIPNTSES
jgi:hypothetical protein